MKKTRLFYERYAINDFSEHQMKKYSKKLTDEDKKIIESIRKMNEEYLKNNPLSAVKKKIQAKIINTPAEKERPRWREYIKNLLSTQWRNYYKIILPAGALCLLLIIMLPVFLQMGIPDIGYKGEQAVALLLYIKTDKGSAKVKDVESVKQGDSIQLAYKAGEYPYGAIFSIDGRGTVSYYLPANPDHAIELKMQKSEVVLPFALKLDDAPEYELFIFLFSHKMFSLKEISQKLSMDRDLLKQLTQPDDKPETIYELDYKSILLIKKGEDE